MNPLTPTLAPPYFAVIFTALRTEGDQGYAATAARMMELAAQQPGFLGADIVRQGMTINVSYWESEAAIQAWRQNAEHRLAQSNAGAWYSTFRVRVCRVEREYGFPPATPGRP